MAKVRILKGRIEGYIVIISDSLFFFNKEKEYCIKYSDKAMAFIKPPIYYEGKRYKINISGVHARAEIKMPIPIGEYKIFMQDQDKLIIRYADKIKVK